MLWHHHPPQDPLTSSLWRNQNNYEEPYDLDITRSLETPQGTKKDWTGVGDSLALRNTFPDTTSLPCRPLGDSPYTGRNIHLYEKITHEEGPEDELLISRSGRIRSFTFVLQLTERLPIVVLGSILNLENWESGSEKYSVTGYKEKEGTVPSHQKTVVLSPGQIHTVLKTKYIISTSRVRGPWKGPPSFCWE